MKNEKRYEIYVVNGTNGLDVFLNTGHENHYITTRRPSGLLWTRLKDGVNLHELKKSKPRSSQREEQKYYERTRHLIRVVDEFIMHELAA